MNEQTSVSLTFEALGHSQNARGLAQLSASYFTLQERSLSGWFAYMRKFSSELSFIDVNTLKANGSWQPALPDAEQAEALEALFLGKTAAGETVSPEIRALAARPDIVSMLAFFSMMQYPFEQFTRFTSQHQQYYYRDVLGFKTRPPVADKIHLVLALNEDVPAMTLLKGTEFDGGDDLAGNALVYQTKSNTLINHAAVDKVFTLSKHKATDALILTSCLDSVQGIEMPVEGVLTFGETSLDNTDIQSVPDVGFTLATPQLYLSGGKRTLNISFSLKESGTFQDFAFLDYFEVAISTAEGMVTLIEDTDFVLTDPALIDSTVIDAPLIDIPPYCSVKNMQTSTSTGIDIILGSLFPAVVRFEDDSLSEEDQVILPQHPHLSFVLKPAIYSRQLNIKTNFELLSKEIFDNIILTVEVEGVSGVIANNSNGVLDTASPFTPFSHEPRIASKLEFTHPELLVKQVEWATLSFSWLDRPNDWNNYYKAYLIYRDFKDGTTVTDEANTDANSTDADSTDANSTEVVTLDESETLIWDENKVDVYHSDQLNKVFNNLSIFNGTEPINNVDNYQLQFIDSAQMNSYDYKVLPFDNDEANQWPKWFSLVLSNNDFGHSQYAQVVQHISFLNMPFYVGSDITTSESTSTANPIEVQQPYTPLLDSLLLNYASKAEFNLANADDQNQLQHIHPLGRPLVQGNETNDIALLPKFDALGYLYIGLSQVTAPGQFRIYVELDPVDGSNINSTPLVDWHYLSDSGWTFFETSSPGSARIIEDSTYKLLDSGVVTFELPELEMGTNFTGDDRFWIRLSIAESSINQNNTDESNYALYSRIRAIYAQGVEVELVGLENDASHFNQPLPAQSITSLVVPEPKIDTVLQYYPSFGGKSAELDSALATRASERLRHKNRALTAWDYEHLILAEFPEIFQVRCFPNTLVIQSQRQSSSQSISENQAQVALVVVPVNHNPDILQPKVPLYLKRKIERYVEQVAPLAVTTQVLDPTYEQVEFDMFAKISPDFDIESMEGELNQLIIDYMTPWNGVGLSNQLLEKEIYLTGLSAVLERHPAVEGIYIMGANQSQANGEIKHYGGKNNSKNKITPSVPAAILVPALIHNIRLFNIDIPILEGIEKWRMELDFKVS